MVEQHFTRVGVTNGVYRAFCDHCPWRSRPAKFEITAQRSARAHEHSVSRVADPRQTAECRAFLEEPREDADRIWAIVV